jgi:L-seryl-tRNA(Ser) seleniumtransferase
VGEVVAAGADLVTFSGDKLLGGPQAGIAVGRAGLVDRLRRDPLNRALRVDKLTLAALEATLSIYEDPVAALGQIPTLRMLSESVAVVQRRARRCLRGIPASTRLVLGARLAPVRSQVGGGALPLCELESAAVALGSTARPAAELERALRCGRPAVVGRVAEDHLLLDCRTVADDEVPLVTAALRALASVQ